MLHRDVDDFSHDGFTMMDGGLLAAGVEIAKPFIGKYVACRLTPYDGFLSWAMKIPNVLREGLRRPIIEDDPSGVPAEAASKLRRIVSFLQDMEFEEELPTIPTWKAHRLTGNRKGTWSLFVTRELARHISHRQGRDRDHRP